MANGHRVPLSVGLALLVLYGLVLPLLAIQTASAHRYIDGGFWRHSVKNGRLDYYISKTEFESQVRIARNEWRAASRINVKEVEKKKEAEIRISDINECDIGWTGLYDPATDHIRFNKCAMNWQGGDYPGTKDVRESGSTTASRKARTAVHEFGHALGLGHNELGDCNSVMSEDVPYDEPTCYIPEEHDRQDIRAYWP